jgi:chemosensory pili system protein ChpE
LHPEILTVGMLMGVAFAAPPGAVTAETFRRGVRGGFALAFGVQLGSLVGDAIYALLALAGLAALAQDPTLELALGAAGAMFLMYLAWSSFQSARVPMTFSSGGEIALEWKSAFLSGLAISLTNPWAIAFWLSLGGVLATLGVVSASGSEVAVFFASFMLGSALWALVLSLAIARIRRWIRPVIFRAVSIACGVALGAFGLVAASRILFLIVGVASH